MKQATRAYNSWEHDWEFGTITKKSDTERLRNEIRYYRSLPYEYKTLFPQLIEASGWDAESHWLRMEYYVYPDLGHYMLHGELAFEDWMSVMGRLHTIIRRWSNHASQDPGIRNTRAPQRMYIDKTVKEQRAFVDQQIAPALFNGGVILINGQPTPTFEAIWPMVQRYIEESIIPTYRPSFIHGDFCLSNMLYGYDENDRDHSVLKFIDPRGSWGEIGTTGDIRYDVAKIYHSVDAGYEFFNNDQFNLVRAETPSDSWKWSITTDQQWHVRLSALAAFDKEFFGNDGYDKKQITLIEGLIYIGACARHYENPDRQVAMYLVGLQLLNKAMMMNG